MGRVERRKGQRGKENRGSCERKKEEKKGDGGEKESWGLSERFQMN